MKFKYHCLVSFFVEDVTICLKGSGYTDSIFVVLNFFSTDKNTDCSFVNFPFLLGNMFTLRLDILITELFF